MGKLKFETKEIEEIMLNKALEKYETTIQAIAKTPRKTINDVFWLDYVEYTEEEYNEWRVWCRNFIRDNVAPKMSDEMVNTQFAYWTLLYPFKIK
jgi:predicted metalloendopeptidase